MSGELRAVAKLARLKPGDERIAKECDAASNTLFDTLGNVWKARGYTMETWPFSKRADALAPPEPKALTRDDCIALENLCAAKVREVREYAPDDAVEFSRLMKKVIAMRTPAPPRADALEAPPTDTPERP